MKVKKKRISKYTWKAEVGEKCNRQGSLILGVILWSNDTSETSRNDGIVEFCLTI